MIYKIEKKYGYTNVMRCINGNINGCEETIMAYNNDGHLYYHCDMNGNEILVEYDKTGNIINYETNRNEDIDAPMYKNLIHLTPKEIKEE